MIQPAERLSGKQASGLKSRAVMPMALDLLVKQARVQGAPGRGAVTRAIRSFSSQERYSVNCMADTLERMFLWQKIKGQKIKRSI